MLRWRLAGGRARHAVLWTALLVLLVAVAKLHACACTGGPSDWHSVPAPSAAND